MKFSIGYNQDIKLLDLLDIYKDHIEALYFPILPQYLGSGRAMMPNNSYPDEIPRIIKKCTTLNIAPQLLLNATCEGEQGLQEKFFSKIISYIQRLRVLGLQSVVVTNPVYVSEIKKRLKGITIESSVNCYVKNAEHALYLKNLGVDILTIDRDINRNMPLIKEIKHKTGLKIKMLLNEGCLRNCPFRQAHYNYLAHRNRNSTFALLSGMSNDKFSEKIFVQDPRRIFSTSFIAPWALKYYVNLVDYFKLSTRQSTTSTIRLCLKAYIDQRFTGNLVSLLDSACIRPYYEYIDSRALERSGFFEKMMKCTAGCDECGYCDGLIQKAVVTNSYFLNARDPAKVKEGKKAVKIYKDILGSFPSNSEACRNLGKTFFDLKKYSLAMRTAEKAIKLAPQEIKGYLLLGYFLEQLKENNEALSLYQRTLKLFPGNENILLGIGRAYFALKKYNEAIKNINSAIKPNQRKKQMHFLLGCCYEKIGQYKEAITEFNKEKRISLEEPGVNFALARCYKKIGKTEESVREMARGLLTSRNHRGPVF